ncbi:MAG: hypothetical protein BAJATHORv1_10576 [Candidatus Thorarchaeota archaeon]|nr:MAG: hypothetical protein BAJATHORv1_10576 [Candidatus Thorarchaeota archaeon]
MSDIKLFHFGAFCPYGLHMIGEVDIAAKKLDYSFSVYDIGKEPRYAKEFEIFTPYMLLVNDELRYCKPMSHTQLIKKIKNKELDSWRRYTQRDPIREAFRIEDLRYNEIYRSVPICMEGTVDVYDAQKSNWALHHHKSTGIIHFGYIAWSKQSYFPVGANQILPANLIPFPIPEHNKEIAFIICLHSKPKMGDYRRDLIRHAIKDLPSRGYTSCQVIAGKNTAYPNGPAYIFEEYDFEEKTILQKVELKDGYEPLILLEYQFT